MEGPEKSEIQVINRLRIPVEASQRIHGVLVEVVVPLGITVGLMTFAFGIIAPQAGSNPLQLLLLSVILFALTAGSFVAIAVHSDHWSGSLLAKALEEIELERTHHTDDGKGEPWR